jgi:outer membrane receptor protein involved in Fe transport
LPAGPGRRAGPAVLGAASQFSIRAPVYGKMRALFQTSPTNPMIKFLSTGFLALTLASILIQTPLRADDEDYEGNYESNALEHVQVTATRMQRRDIDVSAAVTGIDEEMVLQWAPDVIAEMVRGQPGTYFQQTTPGQGVPIIRGLKGSQILHMVDGIRLNNALFRSAPNQYLGLVDAYAVRRMEIVRGAQGTLYGADAMGGVVNILTPEPEYGGASWQQQSRLYGSFDSVDDGWVLNARTQGGRQGFAFTGGATWQDHSSREAGNGETLYPSYFTSKAADLKFVVDTGERSSLMLAAQVMEQPSTPRYDSMTAGFGEQEPASELAFFKPNRRSFLHARFRYMGQSDWFDQVEAHLARQVISDDRLAQDYGSPEIVTEKNRSTLDGVTLQVNSNFASGISMVWGAEYYTDAIDSTRFGRFEGSDVQTAAPGRFPDGSSMDSMALYMSGQWLDTDRFSLSAGLRYSWFDIRLPADDNHGVVRLEPSHLTGDLQVVYTLKENVKLVSNIGNGFRPPNIFDLSALGPRPGNRFNVANTDLGPETVWSYDLGIKAESGPVELELFVFYLDYADKITSVYTGEVTGDGRLVVRSENLNQVDIHGLEAGLNWAIADGLRLFAVANYTHGKEQEDGGATYPADRIPPLNGQLGLEYFIDENWRLEPYLMFAGEQDRLSPRDAGDPRINPMGTPGWGTLNLLLDWQATPTLQVGLRLENLTDKYYREHASGIDAPGRNLGVWVNCQF